MTRDLRGLAVEVHHDRGALAEVRARVGYVTVYSATVPYEALPGALRLLATAVEIYQRGDEP